MSSAGDPPADEGYRRVVSLEAAASAAEQAGRGDDALAARTAAIEAAAQLGRPRLLAALFQRLGRAMEAAWDIQTAVIAYESGLEALEQDPADLAAAAMSALARMIKGYVSSGSDAPPDLFSAPLASDLHLAEQDPHLGAKLLLDIGNAYLRQPQDKPAERAYELALERLPAGDAGAAELRGHALAHLAIVRRRHGDPDRAEALAREALDLLGGSAERRKPLAVLAALQGDRGRIDAAIEGYREVIALCAEAGDGLGKVRNQTALGTLHVRASQWDAARQAFAAALEDASSEKDPEVRWRAAFGAGRCQKEAGELDAAVASFRAALEVVDRHRGLLATDEGQVAFQEGARALYDQLLDVQMLRAAAGAAPYDDALAIAEEARGRVLGSISDVWRDVPRRPPISRFQQSAPGQHIDRRPRGPAPQRVEPLARLVLHVLEDRTALFLVEPGGRVHGRAAPLGHDALRGLVEDLRAALDVDTTRRGIGAKGAANADPRPTSKKPRPPSGRPPPPPHDEILRSLHAALFAPVADLVEPGATLVVEPHGVLWLVPFGALRAADGAWLSDRHPLIYTPSAEVLQAIRAAGSYGAVQEVEALLVGNPVMPELPAQGDDGLSLLPLPGAEEEARAIQELFGPRARMLVGQDANEPDVVAAMADHGVLHLATHGIADSEDPLASLIALAPVPGAGGDSGLLTARQVMKLSLHADLVVLSACQTALGAIRGEGVIGLGRAFLWAGARSVVVSQWSVDDAATTELMVAFYEAYLAGADKAVALQQAMRALRQLEPAYEHPRCWAPFMLIGAER